MPDTIAWEFYDWENAKYRRPGPGNPVSDVLVERQWVPYSGRDGTAPHVFGDPIADPLAAKDEPPQDGAGQTQDDGERSAGDWLPQAYFGTVETPLPNPSEGETDDPDDDELAETPIDVVMMLGFDPLIEFSDDGEDGPEEDYDG